MTKTLQTALLITLAFFLSTIAFATKEVGNGGNVIVCKDPSNAIRSVEILDYFEVRTRGDKLRLDPSLGSYSAMLKQLFQSWESVAPKRMAQYEKWLSEFETDSAILSGIRIPPIDDTGVIGIPDDCEIAPAAFQRPESQLLPGMKRYTINKNLWDHMPEIEKAGLVLHELVYREGIQAGHSSSFATRYFNGYLASATPDSKQYMRLVQLLPLEWVEFGHGLAITLGTGAGTQFQKISTITQDDFIGGNGFDPSKQEYPYLAPLGAYSGIFGDVSSEHLKIRFKSLSPAAPNQSGQIEVSHKRIRLSNLADDPIETLTASIDGLEMEFNHLPLELSFFELSNYKNHLQIAIQPNTIRLDALNVNPTSSFYVQADGSRINSITKILPWRSSVPFPEKLYYGDGFVTASGDTWLYDYSIGKYVKK